MVVGGDQPVLFRADDRDDHHARAFFNHKVLFRRSSRLPFRIGLVGEQLILDGF